MAYTEKNIKKTKARLQELRDEHDLTFIELAAQLERQEQLPISHASLSLYEIDDPEHEKYSRTASMSIDKLVALADFYRVPVDFLLGRIDTRQHENINIGNILNLSDDAIENLRSLYEEDRKHIAEKGYCSRSDIVSELLANRDFLRVVGHLATAYEYCNHQAKFEEQTFWDESGDYSEDKRVISASVAVKEKLLDADYATTAEFYFYRASHLFSRIMENMSEKFHLTVPVTANISEPAPTLADIEQMNKELPWELPLFDDEINDCEN